MKVVTREEAQESRTRLLAWVQTRQVGGGGTLSSWIYEPVVELQEAVSKPSASDIESVLAAQREAMAVPEFDTRAERAAPSQRRRIAPPPEPEIVDFESLTARVVQRRWRTPTEFPQCPAAVSDTALAEYLSRLTEGAVFGRNRYGDSTVFAAALGPDGALSVVCSIESSVKGWSHARVFIADGMFIHEAGGTFFAGDGAMKAHCVAIGAPTDAYGETIDDYCS